MPCLKRKLDCACAAAMKKIGRCLPPRSPWLVASGRRMRISSEQASLYGPPLGLRSFSGHKHDPGYPRANKGWRGAPSPVGRPRASRPCGSSGAHFDPSVLSQPAPTIRNPLTHNDLYLSLDNNLKSAIMVHVRRGGDRSHPIASAIRPPPAPTLFARCPQPFARFGTRRNSRNSNPLIRLLHNLRTPRVGVPSFKSKTTSLPSFRAAVAIPSNAMEHPERPETEGSGHVGTHLLFLHFLVPLLLSFTDHESRSTNRVALPADPYPL